MIVNDSFAPHAVDVLGLIVPPVPALDVIAYGPFSVKLAAIVWVAWTFVNVYGDDTATDAPSTSRPVNV